MLREIKNWLLFIILAPLVIIAACATEAISDEAHAPEDYKPK